MLDDFQQQWVAQNRRIEQLVQINSQLCLRAGLAGPRSMLRWSQVGNVLEIVLGVLCLCATGIFMFLHLGEARFWVPAAALHVWLTGAVGLAIARFVRVSRINFDASVIEIQRQVGAIRVFALRSLRVMFVCGVLVWGVPFGVVASRAWLGLDLYALVGPRILIEVFVASVVLAFAALAVCGMCANRLHRSPRLQQFARNLAGHSLNAANDRLARLAAFEGGQ